jgi:predicted branched-subunit amino acid permease
LAGAWYFVPLFGARGMAFAIIAMNFVMPVLFLYFAIRKLREESKKQGTLM